MSACRFCKIDMPEEASYCTKCEQWQDHLWWSGLRRHGAPLLTVALSVGVPFLLHHSSEQYQKAEQEKSRAFERAEREEQAFEGLGEALQKTLDVSNQLVGARRKLEQACDIDIYKDPAAEHDCTDDFTGALAELDGVLGGIAWTLDTVPVASDTYARNSNMKYEWSRSCTNDAPAAECGRRQLAIRYLHDMDTEFADVKPADIALKKCRIGPVALENACAKGVSEKAPKARAKAIQACVEQRRADCRYARETMKRMVMAPIQRSVVELLCSITRDTNELRVNLWKSMRPVPAEGFEEVASERLPDAISFEELAKRLEAITKSSDCARRLHERPIDPACPFGKGFDGECLRAR